MDWSSISGIFSNSSSSSGWMSLASSFISSKEGQNCISQLPNLLANFNSSNNAEEGNAAGSSTDFTGILSNLPKLLANFSGSKSTETKENTTEGSNDKKNKWEKALEITLREPGSETETGKGKTMAKIGKPIGKLIGSYWGPIGSTAGTLIGEDAGGRFGDTLKVLC